MLRKMAEDRRDEGALRVAYIIKGGRKESYALCFGRRQRRHDEGVTCLCLGKEQTVIRVGLEKLTERKQFK